MVPSSRSFGLFAPPRFLTMPNAGVDISDTSVKYVQFEPNARYHHGIELARHGSVDVPEGALNRVI